MYTVIILILWHFNKIIKDGKKLPLSGEGGFPVIFNTGSDSQLIMDCKEIKKAGIGYCLPQIARAEVSSVIYKDNEVYIDK